MSLDYENLRRQAEAAQKIGMPFEASLVLELLDEIEELLGKLAEARFGELAKVLGTSPDVVAEGFAMGAAKVREMYPEAFPE